MQQIKNRIVSSSVHQKPIITDVFYKGTNKPKPVVIFCHGYKGYKDWGAWNLMAEAFSNEEVFFVKFNFSHNGGTLEEPIDFPDLEAFGQNNYTTELADLEDVINWVIGHNDFSNEIDRTNITLIGHSRGGGIVSIKASENSNISNVISWAGVSDYGVRFPNGEQLQGWEMNGVSYILNSRTHQKMPHYFQFYKDFKEHEERLTIKSAVEKLNIPHLIIHGTEDDVVLPKEAENLNTWNSESTLIMIQDMNHPLGCTQPWEASEMPIFLQEVVLKSLKFVLKSPL